MFRYLSKPLAAEPFLTEQTGLPESELAEWRGKVAEIDENWDWFSGEKLKETDNSKQGTEGEPPLLYPLQINPIIQAARLHAFALAGEVPDTADPLVQTVLEPKDETDESKTLAEVGAKVLAQVEYENNGRPTDTDAFLSIQPLGAIIAKIGLESDQNLFLPSGIRWEYIDPRDFWCHWGANYWELSECWIKRTISAEEAKAYGIDTNGDAAVYIEYWNRTKYWIKVDGKFAKDANGVPYDRIHNWGFVPFIYIPHERAGSFWGRSMVPEGIGLTKELNSRMADVGDSVRLGVASPLVGTNMRTGYPIIKKLPDGTPYVDIGRTNLSTDPQPRLDRVAAPTIPTASENFNQSILEYVRESFQTPEIAYGKEEGSQRSGQTLYNRMWPLLAHVRTERTNWTAARNIRAEMTLRVLARLQRQGITEAHLGHRMRQLWAPMVPVDRGQLVDELIQRKQADAISLDHLVERFGDTEDHKAEVERIRKDVEWITKLEKPPAPPKPVAPKGPK